jgi:hypothetical protein
MASAAEACGLVRFGGPSNESVAAPPPHPLEDDISGPECIQSVRDKNAEAKSRKKCSKCFKHARGFHCDGPSKMLVRRTIKMIRRRHSGSSCGW